MVTGPGGTAIEWLMYQVPVKEELGRWFPGAHTGSSLASLRTETSNSPSAVCPTGKLKTPFVGAFGLPDSGAVGRVT